MRPSRSSPDAHVLHYSAFGGETLGICILNTCHSARSSARFIVTDPTDATGNGYWDMSCRKSAWPVFVAKPPLNPDKRRRIIYIARFS